MVEHLLDVLEVEKVSPVGAPVPVEDAGRRAPEIMERHVAQAGGGRAVQDDVADRAGLDDRLAPRDQTRPRARLAPADDRVPGGRSAARSGLVGLR